MRTVSVEEFEILLREIKFLIYIGGVYKESYIP